MALVGCSAATDSRVVSGVLPVKSRLEVRSVARRETRSAMSRPLRSAGRLVTVPLIGGLIITATVIPASGQPQDRAVAELIDFSSDLEAEGGKVPSHAVLTGTLRAGESETAQTHTCSGTEYKAVGVCDFDCSDLDLTAYNATAEVMDSDVLPDDVPIVYFTPTACGFTTLSVEMVECDGSCEWAVQLYIDDPMPLSDVSGAGNGDAPTGLSNWALYLGTYRGTGGDTTILRHENQLVMILPFSHDRDGSMAVLGPTDSSHLLRVESDESSVDGEKVRFVVNGSGAVTAVFVAGEEYRRVG